MLCDICGLSLALQSAKIIHHLHHRPIPPFLECSLAQQCMADVLSVSFDIHVCNAYQS